MSTLLDNIEVIDEAVYGYIVGFENTWFKPSTSFTEPRTDEFWQKLNEKIFKDLSNLVTLRLYDKAPSDVSFLRFLSHLKFLQIDTNHAIDFDSIPQLNHINLSSAPLFKNLHLISVCKSAN